MSYSEALSLAMSGTLNNDILDVMRRENLLAEDSGSILYQVEAKVNLGVALLQLGNRSPEHSEYMRYYRESEDILLAALRLVPTDSSAQSNLMAVRKSVSVRSPVPVAGSSELNIGNDKENVKKPYQTRKLTYD